MSRGRRLGLAAVAGVALLGAATAVGAVYHVEEDDSRPARIWKLASRRLLLEAIHVGLRLRPGEAPAVPSLPAPGRPAFVYEDTSHPYFAAVRRDPRLRSLYRGGPWDVPEFARAADRLRDRAPHGLDDHLYHRLNLIELLDLSDAGARYACVTITRMLIQALQAAGGAGRLVTLPGHAVAELWSPRHGKWVMVDADYDVHFRAPDGTPLSAYEIHRRVRDGERHALVAHPGPSRHALFRAEQADRLLDLYAPGVGIHFYAGWVGSGLPRWHPGRSPAFTAVFLGEADLETRLQYAAVVRDPAPFYAPPGR